MGIRDPQIATADIPALEWAAQHVGYLKGTLVVHAPWSTTYRLGEGDGVAYLKMIPRQGGAVLDATARLAQHFADHMPKVLAFDASRGWLLTQAHGMRTLDYDEDEADLVKVVQTYARMEADAALHPGLLKGLPKPRFDQLLSRLMVFLKPQTPAAAKSGLVNAEYFVGKFYAARYAGLFALHLKRLAEHLKAAEPLPPTLSHGDLRPPNAALAADGRCVLVDWDDAAVGPAGMSLHGCFDGCVLPTVLLSGSAAAQAAASTPDGQVVWAYVKALAESGYAERAVIEQALPAAICGGVIQFVLNFAKFPGESDRVAVGTTIGSRLSDILDLCDWMTAPLADEALQLADDYEKGGHLHRAHALLQDQLKRRPGDTQLLARFARVCRKHGVLEQAEEVLKVAVRRLPRNADMHALRGAVMMERLQLPQATRILKRALQLQPDHAQAQADLSRVGRLLQMRKAARVRANMPILNYPPQKAGQAQVCPDEVAMGVELFKEHGTLQINNAFPLSTIKKLQAAFFKRYAPYFVEADHPDALHLGDKRYMLTVDMRDPFDDPDLLGAPTVLPIIRGLLGEDCVMGAFTAVISLPGSQDQRLHKDHPALFPQTEWSYTLPVFATQIIIPLVPLDEFSGTTRFYKGTHKCSIDLAEEMGHQDPMVPLGGCLLTDYRCAHRGLGNRSEVVRPILTLIYNRPWFHDFKNYGKQPPLRISDEAYENLPEDVQTLLQWWKEERLALTLDQSVLLSPKSGPVTAVQE